MPGKSTNSQNDIKKTNQINQRESSNNKAFKEISLDTPSKKDPQSKMSLKQETGSSNKIESSSKKGRTMNNFGNKPPVIKTKLNLDFNPKKNKDEKMKDNSNENARFRAKELMNRSKISEKIQNDSAKKNIESTINNKDELENLKTEISLLKKQIQEYKILLLRRDSLIKTKDLEIKKKDNAINDLEEKIKKIQGMSESNKQMEEKIELFIKENKKKDEEIKKLNLQIKEKNLNANFEFKNEKH